MADAYDERYIRFSHATESVLKAITRYKNDTLAPFGLRGMHLLPMVCLSRNEGGLTPGELARLCGVDKAMVSRSAGDLKSLGYLIADGEQRYNARLTLTQKGRAVMAEVSRLLESAVLRITAGVTPAELETFYRVLGRMRRNADGMNGRDPDGTEESTEV